MPARSESFPCSRTEAPEAARPDGGHWKKGNFPCHANDIAEYGKREREETNRRDESVCGFKKRKVMQR